MRVLGVIVANHSPSEVRVAAQLVGERSGVYEPLFLCHAWSGDRDSARRFREASGSSVASFDFGWRPNPRGERSLLAKLGSWLLLHLQLPRLILAALRFRPDLIYSSQQVWDCYVATVLAKVLGVPQLVHLHYTVGPWLGRHSLRRLADCDRLVCVSDFIRREALDGGVASDRAFTLRNAVTAQQPSSAQRLEALRRELGLVAGQPIVSTVGRIDPQKGQADVLEAFSLVAPRVQGAHLLIVGEGPTRGTLEALAGRLGIGDRVTFTGARSDVADLLALTSVFIHPAYEDPCPLAVLEAQAAGKPVVAYADGGLPEQVVDGTSGLLVPTGDRGALAAALLRLLDDEALATKMGLQAREHMAQAFSPERAGVAFGALVRGAVERSRGLSVEERVAVLTG